jgi:hypothetical protein
MIDLIPTTEQYNQWTSDWSAIRADKRGDYGYYLITSAAQWGADQELEECVTLVDDWAQRLGYQHYGGELRNARRPKPQSEAEQALVALEADPKDGAMIMIDSEQFSIIHRALERLKKLEKLND